MINKETGGGADLLPVTAIPHDLRLTGAREEVSGHKDTLEDYVEQVALARSALFRLLTKDNPAYQNMTL